MSDDIDFQCPFCQQIIGSPPDMAGEIVDCPGCNRQITVPVPKPKPISLTPVDAVAPQHKACPFCGEQILSVAKKCKHCGEFLEGSLSSVSATHPSLGVIAGGAAPDPITQGELSKARNLPHRGIPVIAGAGLIMCCLVGVAFYHFSHNGRIAPSNASVARLNTPAPTASAYTEYEVTVTVLADKVTDFNFPKNPLQYELYRNGETIRQEVHRGSVMEFVNVPVKTGDKIRAKVHWRNGFGAIVQTDETLKDTTIVGNHKVYLNCR